MRFELWQLRGSYETSVPFVASRMGAIESKASSSHRAQRRRKPEVVSHAHGAIWEIIYLLNTYPTFNLL